MHFSEDKPAGNYVITAYTPQSITVNNRVYDSSLYVSPAKLVHDVPLRNCNQLSIETLQFIIELKPELLLLGTGHHLQFPAASIIAELANQKIGFEAMDHAAACRTFAVLASEQRDIGALFLIDKINAAGT